MQAQLQALNRVPGVIGTMLCDAEGSVLASAFPPAYDAGCLGKAAAVLVGRTRALEPALGTPGTLDLRFGTARVIVHAGPGRRLVFLCDVSANPALLALSGGDLLRSPAPAPAAPPPVAASQPGRLHQAVQRLEALLQQAEGNPFRLRGQIAVRSGVALELVEPHTPDDPAQLEALRAAVREVLHREI